MQEWSADVVVVGGGGAGLAAAVEAASHGASVLLLEKNPRLGGTTRLSVGSVTASCTPQQRRLGIQDSPEMFVEDLDTINRERGRAERDNRELQRLLAEESARTVEWLMGHGVEFFNPMPEPPQRVPRLHNALPSSATYIYHLERAARRRGARIVTGVRAERLLTEGGRVVGVEGVGQGVGQVRVRATRGVVLASGDFSSHREMKERYLPEGMADIEGINPTSTGDGQRMALEVGARLVNGDLLLGPEIRFVAPPHPTLLSRMPPYRPVARTMNLVARRLPFSFLRRVMMSFITTYLAPARMIFEEGAVLVNREGRRFTNELGQPALAIPHQPERVAYILMDERLARQFSAWPYYISTAPGVAFAYLPDYRRNRPDIYARADTLEALARKLGIPEGGLEETVARYNRAVDEGGGDELGREKLGPGLRQPPYHALGPAKSWVVVTDGGLAVTTRMEVVDGEGRPIPGLYAAGSTGQGGLVLEYHGLHLMWAFASGRIAGRSAALGGGES